MKNYIHGYSSEEANRLNDQANTLDDLLHSDSIFPKDSRVLEVGCGVGSQTKIIAKKNPLCKFTSIDISESSLDHARTLILNEEIKNVEFQLGDILSLKFKPESFDHIFVCFLLEHLSEPLLALENIKKILKTGGTITVIEGDHGSAYYYPRSNAAQKAINCQITLQMMRGGNALIGRELYPLLLQSGFKHCNISPRMVYVDSGRPDLIDGFTKKTFIAMIKSVKEEAVSCNCISSKDFDLGIKDLYRATEKYGVFCYTFFKATAMK